MRRIPLLSGESEKATTLIWASCSSITTNISVKCACRGYVFDMRTNTKLEAERSRAPWLHIGLAYLISNIIYLFRTLSTYHVQYIQII